MLPHLRLNASLSLLLIALAFLVSLSLFILSSVAPSLFPTYFIFIFFGFLVFLLFLKIDFEILRIFSPHLYFLSIFLLFITIIIGQVTRGAVRWIPLGAITIQPSEIMRPFLLLFFAKYITENEFSLRFFIKSLFIALVPLALILVQPSLGITFLTAVGFLGVILSSRLKKRYILAFFILSIICFPVSWFFLQPYQRQRINSFFNPESDPRGAGYNSIQSMISVGSGKLFGRGLGEGVQTQLFFLPEKHTDFIFATIAEELGFLGSGLVLVAFFVILATLTEILGNAKNPTARSYVSGIFAVLFTQVVIHVGMNMGLFPITGIPLPFVSAGGSALLGSAVSVAIAIKARKT